MTRESVMSTPIFDQLLREMAQRAEPRATTAASPVPAPPPTPAAAPAPAPSPESPAEELTPAPRRRHRAD